MWICQQNHFNANFPPTFQITRSKLLSDEHGEAAFLLSHRNHSEKPDKHVIYNHTVCVCVCVFTSALFPSQNTHKPIWPWGFYSWDQYWIKKRSFCPASASWQNELDYFFIDLIGCKSVVWRCIYVAKCKWKFLIDGEAHLFFPLELWPKIFLSLSFILLSCTSADFPHAHLIPGCLVYIGVIHQNLSKTHLSFRSLHFTFITGQWGLTDF